MYLLSKLSKTKKNTLWKKKKNKNNTTPHLLFFFFFLHFYSIRFGFGFVNVRKKKK